MRSGWVGEGGERVEMTSSVTETGSSFVGEEVGVECLAVDPMVIGEDQQGN